MLCISYSHRFLPVVVSTLAAAQSALFSSSLLWCCCFAANRGGLWHSKTQGGVIFRLGKVLRARGRGIILLIATVDRMVRVDLRVITINVASRK